MVQENPKALKHMYGPAFIKRFSKALSEAWTLFDQKSFTALTNELLKLEMKPRVRLIRDELRRQLPPTFSESLRILMKAVESGDLSGFDLWPITEFIQAFGLEDEKLSLEAQKRLTEIFTAEFSIRPFLAKSPDRTLNYLLKCTTDKSDKVRRWASEGSRPRLPWGQKLQHFIDHPELTLPILDKLCADESLFVRKSVANHLNDISKDHPKLVIRVLKAWLQQYSGQEKIRIIWIARHSLRTLIKQGDSDALKLIGIDPTSKVSISAFKLDKKTYAMDERLNFSFKLSSLENTTKSFVVDYKIHYLRNNGSHSAKVFKLKTVKLKSFEDIVITKGHHLKEVTTRVHYPGVHSLEIMINGQSFKKVKWTLT